MIEIRTEVWDYLHKNGPVSLETIAKAFGRPVETVQAATDHEWFAMRGDVVAIAIHQTGHVESRGAEVRNSEEESRQLLHNLFSSGDRTSQR